MDSMRFLMLLTLIFACGKPLDPSSSKANSLDVTVPGLAYDIEFTWDESLQLIALDGHGQSLNLDQIAALRSIRERLPAGSLIAGAVSYLEAAPVDHVLPTRTFEPIRCLRKDERAIATWDTRDQKVIEEEIVVGESRPRNYGCMGRCGIDCGWGAPSAWTQDCLDHDACSFQQKAKNQRYDLDCGDEFDEAADDWLLGVLAGCDGHEESRGPQKNFL